MAHLHRATLTPTKSELLEGWLPGRAWSGDPTAVRDLGSFRLDDPDGEVGMQHLLVQAGDRILHVPVTYRGAPIDGAGEHLLGTMDHSALGKRWMYDACGDPVWLATVAATILTGGTHADEVIEIDGVVQSRQPSATAQGSGRSGAHVPTLTPRPPRDEGDLTVVPLGPLNLHVTRLVGAAHPADTAGTLTGRWSNHAAVPLATLTHA